ncbi:serine/threonine-protein kinase [Kitasatospora sp. NPDC048298]|uniref:serine/threonine-protein kinase n=1 Tax=Kitasatospora sp. NPDC048298 TaxID=3364049 RepID=UPI003723C5C3
MAEERAYAVGEWVAGRFELLERLGVGGMGTVWRARDLMLEREVALKEMRALGSADPGHADRIRERVLREARALARVNHVRAVTVHEVLDHQPFPWLVMELVTGRPLHEVLADGPLPPVQAARIGLDVLGALRAAHAAGILHRDVKPGNVIIRPDGAAVLTDFGIAVVDGSQTLTAPGDIIGSPEYMAPERIRGQAGGPASDLWSLGMLLYVCVEGENPTRRDSVWQTMVAVCDQPLPVPAHGGPLAPVIEALLVKEAGLRPDAATLERRLSAVAEGEAVAGSEAVTEVLRRLDAPTLAGRVLPHEAAPDAGTAPAPLAAPTRRGRSRLPLVLAAAVATVAAVTLPWLGGGTHRSPDSAAPSAEEGTASAEPGSWIAQLAEIPHTTDPAERDRQLAELQRRIPGATLVDSDNWESLPSGYWIVRAPGTFTDGYEALAYCAGHGDHQCSGRYLSQDAADREYQCEPVPEPDPATCQRPGGGHVTTSTVP